MIKREHYLKQIRGFYHSDLIKVITGIRRSGKSVILDLIREEIAKETDNIIYLNFENLFDFDKAPNALKLLDYVSKNRKEGKCYVFLDEVQNINNWPEAVKTLRVQNNSVFITGSNSKMLSNEFLNELSGRFVSFKIRPFVYKEILEYAKDTNFKASISDYLVWGGFPKRFEFKSQDDQIKYLSEIDSTIITHDLILRYKIKKEELFRKVVNFILRNNARIFSAKSIYDYIKNEHYECSVNTIIKFISYLKAAFIIEEIPKYCTKAKRELKYYGKIYNTDVCFNSLRANGNRFDIDHNLENIVYNELIYRGYEVEVFNIDKKEIDFRCHKQGRIFYIQVAYSVSNDSTYDREMSAFASLDNSHQKILITTDQIDYSTSTVRHIKFEDFLMMEEL